MRAAVAVSPVVVLLLRKPRNERRKKRKRKKTTRKMKKKRKTKKSRIKHEMQISRPAGLQTNCTHGERSERVSCSIESY